MDQLIKYISKHELTVENVDAGDVTSSETKPAGVEVTYVDDSDK